MSDSRCAACGHERAFHRRSNMVDPSPCEATVNDASGVVACGCKAAFEVDAQRGVMAVFSGLVAGTLAGGDGHRSIRVEHDQTEAGPPWRLSLWEARSNVPTDSHRHVAEGRGFTIEEAMNAIGDLTDPVEQQKQTDKGLLTEESASRFIRNAIQMENMLLGAARQRLQQWLDGDPEHRGVNRVYRRPVTDEGEVTHWWVVRVIVFQAVGEPHVHEEAASQRLADAIERALDRVGAEKVKE